MILALLLAGTAVDAERAFIADAQTLGQWTAFRKWAAPDAIFLPPENVHEALKDVPDPPKAVDWWPTASFVSCDGRTAANLGGAMWPGGRGNNFTTIWQRQPDGAWKWRLDHGEVAPVPLARTARPVVRMAACTRPGSPPIPVAEPGATSRADSSADRTLTWWYSVSADGGIRYRVMLWTRRGFETVVAIDTPAPKKAPA